MAACEVCGNEYDAAFTVITADRREHVFDSLECAAHAIVALAAVVAALTAIVGHEPGSEDVPGQGQSRVRLVLT